MIKRRGGAVARRRQAAAILGNDRQAAVQRLGSEPGEMRRHDDIRQIEERIMRAGRLVGKYI